MTDNEARETLEIFDRERKEYMSSMPSTPYFDRVKAADFTQSLNIAIEALEEIRQYRAIGTVEECREARERQSVKDIIHNPDGGVDEDWLCPSCGRFCNPYFKHCQHCGQSVKVGDTP